MKSVKWLSPFLFALVLFLRLPDCDCLDILGCNRLREVCRHRLQCNLQVVHQECHEFMNGIKVDSEGDPIPPMSLTKLWLFFPEALNPYKPSRGSKSARSDVLSTNVYRDTLPPMSLVDQWPFLSLSTKGSVSRERHNKYRTGQIADSRSREEGKERPSDESMADDAREDVKEEEDHVDGGNVSLERVRRLLQDFDSDKEQDDGKDALYSRELSRTGADHYGNENDQRQRSSAIQSTNAKEKDYEFYRLKSLHDERDLHYILGVVERARELLNKRNEERGGGGGREDLTPRPGTQDTSVESTAQPRASNRGSHQIEAGVLSGSHVEHLAGSSLRKKEDGAQPLVKEVGTQPLVKAESVHSKESRASDKEHPRSSDIHVAADSQEHLHVENEKESSVGRSQENRGQENKKDSGQGARASEHFFRSVLKDDRDLEQNLATDSKPRKQTLTLQFSERVKPESLKTVGHQVQKVLWGVAAGQPGILTRARVDPDDHKKVHFRVNIPPGSSSKAFDPHTIANKINTDKTLRSSISKATGLTLVHARSSSNRINAVKLPKDKNWDEFAIITAIVGGCTLGLIVASVLICSLKRRFSGKLPIELQKKEALKDYEELCRTQMAVNDVSPRSARAIDADRQRHGLVDGQGKYTKKTWREEPFAFNMDISTGHVILGYMEEHLKNEDKLSQEWEALCNYKADQEDTSAGEDTKNAGKNRYSNVLPYDHTRVKLRETSNVFHSDYINANFITDTDPRNPSYIATQGPLDNTVADFWQMIWEQGVVVIVNLTRLSDMGLPQCHRYWPEEGSEVYNIYQVHLISEHIWCDDYIVRSFYLKHLVTQETRTITQFHFLTWPDLSIPESAKPLLEFRRKVNKCYRGQACPIVVHCNNGVGRTGTYLLVDMVLKKMIKGTKEIDIAATLEHIRDQRPDMVKTKAQFEFCLAAVAEEITAILSSLSN